MFAISYGISGYFAIRKFTKKHEAELFLNDMDLFCSRYFGKKPITAIVKENNINSFFSENKKLLTKLLAKQNIDFLKKIKEGSLSEYTIFPFEKTKERSDIFERVKFVRWN